MKNKVVFFNAPPNAGKDIACEYIVKRFNRFIHMEFKQGLYDCVSKEYNIPSEMVKFINSVREYKEVPTELFNGLSCRGAHKYVSEEVMKPRYGKSYFGDLALNKIKEIDDHIIDYYSVMPEKERLDKFNFCFSDSGFIEELIPIIKYFSPENVILIRVNRKGCDFSNDSRDFLYPEKLYSDIATYDVDNFGTKEEYLMTICEILKGENIK